MGNLIKCLSCGSTTLELELGGGGAVCALTPHPAGSSGARALTHTGWDSGSVSFPSCGPGGAGRGGVEGGMQSAGSL